MKSVVLGGALCALAAAQHGPETVTRGTKQFSQRIVASGLGAPWEITWGPDNKLWITERTAKRVTRIDPASGEQKVALTVDEALAPGGQEGVLGMALHPDLLKARGADYVYLAYTYADEARGADPNVPDPKSPYRFLYGKIVRYTFDAASGTLGKPVTLIAGLPAGNDHNGGRLKLGPDRKLYLTTGDQGHNQLGNFCLPIEAQRLPTKSEVDSRNYAAYVGKSLRLELDGGIPRDNPKLVDGVVSHVFTYGHRNIQGIDFSPNGTLYAAEHGPKSDDELNVLKSGGNYGWPHVAGMKDNQAYEFARWAEASTPCSQLRFSDLAIHPAVPREPESAFTKPLVEPLATMFTVPTGFAFRDPACKGVDFICWPTVGITSVEYYASQGAKGIPGWDRVLIVSTLKRGSLYIQPLSADGQKAAGFMSRYFQSENRYRDTAVSPDLRTIFVATDPSGLAEGAAGGAIRRMANPGAILAFTYTGEGGGAAAGPISTAPKREEESYPVLAASAPAARFTAAQAAAGKTAYNSYCAVCHGSTMTNGTMGTPLSGEFFKSKWAGRSAGAFYQRARKTMPPAAPGSLPAEAYTNVLAYVLETYGLKPGNTPLPGAGDALDRMAIK